MDPISAIGLVLTAVQLTSSCLKECRKFIGYSKHSTTYVRSVADDLWAFNGSLKNLQTHYEIYEDSQARSLALPSITKPLSDCNVALDSIREHLESKNLLKRIITGARFDNALKRHLICLKNSRTLFHEVLQADKIVVLYAVEKYTRNLAEDIRDLQDIIGEIDGRNRSDFERVHRSLGSIHNGQKDILRSHEDSRARKEAQARGNNLSDVTFQPLTGCLAQKDRTIIDWLSPLNFEPKQSDVLSSRSGSTGTWILETEEFKDWAIGSGKTLWCTGIPGAGKTVFTSIVVDHLERIVAGPRAAISYVYCSYKDEAIQTPTSLIASILHQILTKPMSVSDGLRALYDHHELKKTRPTVEELSVQLQAYVHNLEKFFVIIDALDECPGVKRDEFLDHIRNLQPAVNLMITTRPASHVANGFPEAACVELRAKDADIQSYCEAKIRSDHRLHFVQDDADLMDVVINTIAENAQKMFLLAVLHIESLASQLNKAQVRNALEKLPKGLDDTYREALQRIARQGQPSLEMAYQVLSWISYAYRPLTVEELRCALAVTPGRSVFDEDAMTPESTLVSVCAGLVAVDPQSRIIRLVHYTTQEFFEKIRDSMFPTAQADITLICLTYLSFDHPRYYDTTYAAILHDIESSPFLSYAAQYWRDHMRASPETNFNELILQILWQPEKVQCILQAMDEYSLNVSDIYKDLNVPPLCAAAILGLESVVLLLLERGADLTGSVMSDGRTPLYIAVELAQLEVIKILIDRGASVNNQEWTPLLAAWYAADLINEERAVAAARLLLDRGAETDYQTDYGTLTASPLSIVAESGNIQLVELLLTYGADANLRVYHGLTALQVAHPGKPRIFQLLVDHGADLHARDNSGESPLSCVSCDSREEAEDIVRALLDLGADIHSRNNSGETALFGAAEMGYCRIIQVLMDYGADIHARSGLGRSVLFSAIDTEYCKPDKVVQFLLEFGADVHPQDSAGDTALARAAAKGLSGTVKLMLDHKSKIDSSNEAGDTALTLAAAAETMLVGSFRYDEKGYHHIDDATRLAASVEGILTSMELLLNHGASVDLKNNAGDTALTLAAAKGKLDAVKLLLNYGANAHAMNEAGDTALSLTTQNGHSEVRQLLLERLSEPNQPPVCTEVE